MTLTNLPPIEYSGRAGKIRGLMAAKGVEALAVTQAVNVRWLTGFGGSNGSVALLPDRLVLVTDGRYLERAIDEIGEAGVEGEVVAGFTQAEQDRLFVEAFATCRSVGAGALGLTHSRWQALAADLPLVEVDGLVEDARRTKDHGELARIERACECADAALADIAPTLGSGVSEADARREFEYRMRIHGADGPSYDTIVASGPNNAARPHHGASDRQILEGDTVVIDIGGLVDGYHSDMTRSFVIGEPSAEQQDLYDLVLAAQLAGLAAIAGGVAATDVDAACRSMITDAGYADWFLHSTGHGVGLVIHEEPFESPTSIAELRAGDVVTVEPGLYRVGFGGFRIEDLVEVTETGCRILTKSPKDSPCLPLPPTI